MRKKIDYSDIPPLSAEDFKRARRLTSGERAKFNRAYHNTFHTAPPRIGRPFKYPEARLKPVSIRLHPHILTWARKEAHKQNMGYQGFINEFLLKAAA
jgi:hypothetical protein